MSQNDFDDQAGGDGGHPQPSRYRGLLGWVVITALAILVAYLLMNGVGNNAREISRAQLQQFLANPDALQEFYLSGSTLHGKINTAKGKEYENIVGPGREFTVHMDGMEVAPFIQYLHGEPKLLALFHDDKDRSYIPEDTLFWPSIIAFIPWIVIFIAIWFFVSRQMRSASGPGGVLSFGRSRARLAKKERVKVTFGDVAGIDDAKEEVQEIVEFLKHPEKFQALGGRIPRGVMLVGPPGTGKTLLAKAIAGEANVPFFSISGSDFVEMFVGVGASRVRDLFRMAKESSPCIVFLDEIDAVGRRRTHEIPGGGQETSQTLNAILVEMDGFETNEQVIVIGATNRPDVLDPALRRPGRFDREVVVHLPDIKEREAILKVHARKVKLDVAADLSVVARGTPGFSGADLAAVINESAIHASLLNKSSVEQSDLEECRDKVRWGRSRRSRAMDEAERRNTAFHEAGHALLSILLEPDVEPLHKVTIIPRGISLGATMTLPEKDTYTMYRRQALAAIKVCFGGRLSEELCMGDISAGASMDIRQATSIARRMVCDWGMSQRLGPVRYAPAEETAPWGGEYMGQKEHSDATAHEIDEEILAIVSACYREAKELLQRNLEALHRIAEALLKREVLNADEVRQEIAGIPLDKPPAAPPAPLAPLA
jgi:cell division protease FtsH